MWQGNGVSNEEVLRKQTNTASSHNLFFLFLPLYKSILTLHRPYQCGNNAQSLLCLTPCCSLDWLLRVLCVGIWKASRSGENWFVRAGIKKSVHVIGSILIYMKMYIQFWHSVTNWHFGALHVFTCRVDNGNDVSICSPSSSSHFSLFANRQAVDESWSVASFLSSLRVQQQQQVH
jgi:hypothetical protein